jgi:iron(III) transport system substrate-binding protein
MTAHHIARRTLLAGLATLPSLGASAAPAVTDAMREAARREGTVVFHTSIELSLCEKMIAGFNVKEPNIRVQLERTGAERILQRINQEYSSGIYAADVVESSDTGIFVDWKKRGWLAAFVPDDVPLWPQEERDPDGHYASVRASLSIMAYNTKQIKPEDAPRGFADLLNPKWRMRIVKAHPSYSGSILTSTYVTAQEMGWDFFEKLGKQRVLQVQSAVEPPKKVAVGERSIEVDGSEYVVLALAEQGSPIAPIYSIEGSPSFSGPAAVFEKAAHPNAARVFANYLFTLDCQQIMSDVGGLRSFHPGVAEKPGRKPLKEIKLLRASADVLAETGEDTKKRYLAAFGV